MVSTHTVPLRPLHPLGGFSKGGYRTYIGRYNTMRVAAGTLIQTSPVLDIRWVDVKELTTNAPIPMSAATASASTGLMVVGATAAASGVDVIVIGK